MFADMEIFDSKFVDCIEFAWKWLSKTGKSVLLYCQILLNCEVSVATAAPVYFDVTAVAVSFQCGN